MGSAIAARILRYAVAAASLWYLGVHAAVAIARLRYPFDLEWMEGGSVDHVVRVLAHQALYVQPQIAFIPFEYPPLYFYVSALVAKVVGIGYFPLRLVSFASTLVCFACIYRIVAAETGRAFAGLIAAGLFAATFRISGAWFDLARVDSLFMALFLGGVVVLHRAVSVRAHLTAGILFSLSFLTKQTALAMAAPLVLYALYVHRRPGVWLAAMLTAAIGVSTLLLHLATDGWFTTYVWVFPFRHVWAREVWLSFWTHDILGPLPIAFTTAVVMAAWLTIRRRPDGPFWLALLVGMIGAAYRSRLQTGGYDNVLLPAYAVTAMLFGLAVASIGDVIERRSSTYRRFAEAAVYAVCLVQMALLGYDPSAQIPRPTDRAAGERLLTLIAGMPGDVMVPYHGYMSTAAGKPPHAHLMQVHDILKFADAESAKLSEQFRTAIRETAFDAIVLDDRTNYYFMRDIEETYVLQPAVFSERGVFLPVTGGIISRPEYIYVPKARAVGQ